ncbi:hypothetical protein CONCODRAFT_2100 [Conidiobolus coronatus NRRL 28638]|uniref:Uncharacterized protein n=1 Tax=Conidiobolus coronatus (strain ATCC 28846 / CBS 209.66 / NRRL 28638) TaxID=796925 RepID=A0A137PIE2_CONC2|nr:hypothetical protein CONCODRAFT_2100 [Conidiobolus coronatus NRRL 28638]|eukprot:KXN74778.1 hypothetical protein CONCODRAFT_2100 [Conidiobolus coronatus NRRL 28638]
MFQSLIKSTFKYQSPTSLNQSEPIHIQLQKCWDRISTCYDINHIENIELTKVYQNLCLLAQIIQLNGKKEGTISEFINNERCLSILIGYGRSDTPKGILLHIVDFLITTLPYIPNLPLNDPNLSPALHSILLLLHNRIVEYFKDPSLLLNQNQQLNQLHQYMTKYNNLLQRHYTLMSQFKDQNKLIRWLGLAENTTVKMPIVYLPFEILINQLPPTQPHDPSLIHNFQKLEKLNLVGLKQLILLNYDSEVEKIVDSIVDKTIDNYLKLITNISTSKVGGKLDSFKLKHETRKLELMEGNYFKWLEYLFKWWHQLVSLTYKLKRFELMKSVINKFEANFLKSVLIPSLFTSEELTSHRLPYLIHLIQTTHHSEVYKVWSRVLLGRFEPIKTPFLHHLTSLITPNNQTNTPSSLNLHYFNLIITLVNNGQLGHFFQIQITPRYGIIDNSPLNTPPLQPICQSILDGINQLEPGEIPNHDEHFMNLLLNSNTIDDHSHHLDLIHLNEETNLVDEDSVVPLPLIPLLLTWLNELFEFHPMENNYLDMVWRAIMANFHQICSLAIIL